MCTTCGCSGEALDTLADAASPHEHAHAPVHEHGPQTGTVLSLEQRVLARNDAQAALNRRRLAAERVLGLNLMSSPGAGKTTLLERTVRELGAELPLQVVEGDQATDYDARRLQEVGCSVVQLNTGTGCHLDAAMVGRALDELPLLPGSVLVVENVGNLVCPALFDLGEQARVVIAAVTDGDDKPVKYPHMFRAATVVLLNKVDLLPFVAFDPRRFVDLARQVNPGLQVLPLSATRGDGIEAWYAWLREQAHRAAA